MLKRILTAITLILATVTSNAEMRWGPTADANFTTFHWKEKLLETDMRTGCDLGIMTEIMIPGIGFGVDAGIRYSMQGSRVNFGEWEVWNSDGFRNQNVMLHSIQVPLHLRFKYTRLEGLEETIAPLAYVGPVFAFNISSNCKALETPAGSVYLDFGLGAELFERFQVSAGYLWGLSYAVRTVKLENLSARADGWHVNLSYFF